ncbi:MAG: phosphoadenosine phosphosulfate reductase family protein [Pseudomonadota bacterium]
MTSFRLDESITADRKIQDVFNLFEDTSQVDAPKESGWVAMTFKPTLKAAMLVASPAQGPCPKLPINSAPEIDAMIAKNAVIAFSVSGGKDGNAAAIATVAYLDKMGHTGPRVLIHADLGVVEWKDSLPCCERLAEKLGLELMVVRRRAGDMMDRWEGRWRNNVQRFADLSCVKLILPWSTPSMRFCTSELKSAIIASALRKRFPDETIVSVTGIRREESANRAKMDVCGIDARLTRRHAVGLFWNAIIDWHIEQVFQTIIDTGLALHEAYTKYDSSRVSCVFCIMSAAKDLVAAANCEDNHQIYRRMVELEVTSTYAFQGGKWLGDVAPHLLAADLVERLHQAKQVSALRQEIESKIPKHLLYSKGWPTSMPTKEEAELLAEIRKSVAGLVGIEIQFTTAESILERYALLIATKALKDASASKSIEKKIEAEERG